MPGLASAEPSANTLGSRAVLLHRVHLLTPFGAEFLTAYIDIHRYFVTTLK